MAKTELSEVIESASVVAREAGGILCSYFQSDRLEVAEKAYLDVVTQADTEAERHIVSRLSELFPDDALVGEEGTNRSSTNGRVWYIDPLDGTFNYSRGIPFWCVSIGLVEDVTPVLGIVYEPVRDELFTAVKGQGAFLNGAPISASNITEPIEATLQLTVNYDREVIEQSIKDFNAVVRDVMRLRNMGALALELAYLACGRLDAVCQRGSHPWDYAAGVLLCQEAGATVTDIDGAYFDLETDDCLAASTMELHGRLGKLLTRC